MPNLRLTKATVEKLQPPTGKEPVLYWDTGSGCVGGFGIRVAPNGKKVAILQYRLKGAGRAASSRRFTIGEIGPDLTFTDARGLAETHRASVVGGADPARDTKAKALATVEKEKLAKERTLKVLADAWLVKKKHLRTYKQLERIVENQLTSLHKRDVASLTYADLEVLIEGVQKNAPHMARQIRGALVAILDLGLRKGWVAENIASRIEVDAPAATRDRVLSEDELKAVWKGAAEIGWPYGLMVQLLMLTAARREEVAGLDWSELDMDQMVWRLPAARAKNGDAHLIHLSPQAVDVIDKVPRSRRKKHPETGLLFSTTKEKPFSGFSKAKSRLDEKAEFEDWRLHDLRRTAATAMSEMGYSIQVVERVLNHKGISRSGLIGIYQRSELLAERKAAIEAWGSHVQKVLDAKK